MEEIAKSIENDLKQVFPEMNIAVEYENVLNNIPKTVKSIKKNIANITQFFQYAINKLINNKKIGDEIKNRKFIIRFEPIDNETHFYIECYKDKVYIKFLVYNHANVNYQAGFAVIDLFNQLIENMIYPITFYIIPRYFKFILEAHKSQEDLIYDFIGYFHEIEKPLAKTIFNAEKLLKKLISTCPFATRFRISTVYHVEKETLIELFYGNTLQISYKIDGLHPFQSINIIIGKTKNKIDFPWGGVSISYKIIYKSESTLSIIVYSEEKLLNLIKLTFALWKKLCQYIDIDETVFTVFTVPINILKGHYNIIIFDNTPLDEVIDEIKNFYRPLKILNRLGKLLKALKC